MPSDPTFAGKFGVAFPSFKGHVNFKSKSPLPLTKSAARCCNGCNNNNNPSKKKENQCSHSFIKSHRNVAFLALNLCQME